MTGLSAVKGFGWLTAAFGVFACLMVLSNLGQQTAGDATIRFIASAVLAAVGVLITRRARPIVPPVDVKRAEFAILASARRHGGRVTATEVAVETALPIAMANAMLEALSRRGACLMSIAEAGIVVFEFPELEPPEPEPDPDPTAQARRAAARQRSTS